MTEGYIVHETLADALGDDPIYQGYGRSRPVDVRSSLLQMWGCLIL